MGGPASGARRGNTIVGLGYNANMLAGQEHDS